MDKPHLEFSFENGIYVLFASLIMFSLGLGGGVMLQDQPTCSIPEAGG